MPGVEIETPTGYLSADEKDLPTEEKAFGTWTYPDKRLEFTEKQVRAVRAHETYLRSVNT